MTDFVQLQNDVTLALLAAPALANINVVQYRKLRLQSVVDFDVVWVAVRNGRSGAGVLVEMPVVNVTSPNVTGPAFNLIQPFAVLEEPNLNFAPETGTLLSAEEIAQTIFDLLHLQAIEGIGTLQAVGIKEATDFAPGLLAYRVEFKIIVGRPQTPRCLTPTITPGGGNATLTAASGDIYFTLDGSFPAPSNPAAQLYAAPVPVVSGQVVRAAAFAAGFNPSEIRRLTIP